MVVIPPGQFLMGSPPGELERQEDEGPVHAVAIALPLAVGRFEVTFEEWGACVGERSCPVVEESLGPAASRGKRPVVNVNHDQAMAYAEWLSERTGYRYRLLSEAEWEYAARGGGEPGVSRPWGNSTTRACQFANVLDQTYRNSEGDRGAFFDCEDGFSRAAPVGSFRPNGFGLHDMLGNVWEWVADCYHDSYQGAPADGSAWVSPPCKRRVNRGGCWFDRPAFVRTANRSGNPPLFRDQLLGFRVARALP
jgi:formylglycine-generating enzyme required for sulfatase activity